MPDIGNIRICPDMMSGEEYVQLAREAKRAGNNNKYVDDSQIFHSIRVKRLFKMENYFDWVDAVSSPAFMTNHTISATGGNEIATYALSAGYF